MRFSICQLFQRRKAILPSHPVDDQSVAASSIDLNDSTLYFWRRRGSWEDVPVVLASPDELAAIKAGTLKVFRSR